MSEIELLHERARVAEELVTRAWSDEAFKALLIADPARAVEAAYGVKLPASFTLTVLEETEDTRYLVIPYRPSACDELSEEDLAAVAGGLSASENTTGRSAYSASILRGINVTNQVSSTNTLASVTSSFDATQQLTC